MPENLVRIPDEEKRRRLSLVVKKLKGPVPIIPREGIETNEEELNTPTQTLDRRRNILNTAAENQTLQRLLDTKPIFYENQENAPKQVHLENDFAYLTETPGWQALIQNPTQYIEQQLPNIPRGEYTEVQMPKGVSIREMITEGGYDISRVKIITVGDITCVVKRVAPEKIKTSELEEYTLSRRAHEAGIPTPRTIGYIRDQGNTYLLFEYLKQTASKLEVELTLQQKDYFLQVNSLCIIEGRVDEYLKDSIIRHRLRFSEGYEDNEKMRKDQRWREDIELLEYTIFLVSRLKYLARQLKEVPSTSDAGDILLLCNPDADVEMDKHVLEATGLDLYNIRARINNKDYNYYTEVEKEKIETTAFRETLYTCLEWMRQEKIKEVERRKQKLIEKIMPILERQEFGASLSFPYRDFVKIVTEKCLNTGIMHKDLAPRNILIQMDPTGQYLQPDENGNAQFYIIDWEQ